MSSCKGSVLFSAGASAVAISLLFTPTAFAQSPDVTASTTATAATTGAASPLKFDAFVDTYYAYDTNGPTNFDRAFTTQPARSDEFNINLAYVGATYAQDRIHGRLALQAGTSVQSNYAAEPTNGTVSGPSLSRNIQEAYAGYEVAKGVWIDAGTYFSHVGAEGFISRDNLTYTRSLVADYSPYYQSGVRATYQVNDKLSLQGHLINGWQTVSENNHSKMGGTQIAYAFAPNFSVSYSTLFGRESQFRHFHDVVAKYSPSSDLDLVAQVDAGFQDTKSWWGAVAIARYKLTPVSAISLRAEKYEDPDQVIITTSSTSPGFKGTGASIGYDRDLAPQLKWRSEYRQLWTTEAVVPSSNGLRNGTGLAVTSLALSLN